MTIWVAVADFFVAIAVVSFALFAAHRRPAAEPLPPPAPIAIPVEEAIQLLTRRLREELVKSGVPAEIRDKDFAIALPSFLFFDSAKWKIRNDEPLVKVADALKRVQGVWRDDFVLIIQGYTDARPPKAGAAFRDNLELSRLRARAVEESLDRNGIRPPRFQLVSQGMGPNDPVVKNCVNGQWLECGPPQNFLPSEQLEKNRRIELKFGVFTGNRRPAAGVAPAASAVAAPGRSQ